LQEISAEIFIFCKNQFFCFIMEAQIANSFVMPNKNHSSTSTQKLAAFAAFLLPLFVYVFYLCPTIAAGDSGEFITTAKILGAPHPPGYPLYTLIGHVFTYLPMNSIAWRVNLTSAIFAALTCLLVYLSLHRITGRIWPALAAAWGLALSRFFWQYAEVAEVFALNNFFTALLTYVLIVIPQNTTVSNRPSLHALRSSPFTPTKLFWAFSFFFGLALTNHHTIILLAPAALWILWRSSPEFLKNGGTLGIAVILFFVGLTPYLYLPIAAGHNPAINWDNPVTLENFWRLLTRADYGGFSPYASKAAISRISQLPAFFTGLYQQFTAPGIALAILGLLNFKRYKNLQIYLLLAFFFSGIFFVIYANVAINNPLLLGVLHRFYIMPAVIFSFWIGLGLENINHWIAQKKLPTIITKIAPIAVTAGLLIWEFATNVDEADFRENFIAEDFAHNILLSLPEGALFFVSGDVASIGVDYLQIVERKRPDVIALDQAKLTYDWYYAQAKARFPNIKLLGKRYDGTTVRNQHLIMANIRRQPVCFMDFKEQSYQEEFLAQPRGLVYEVNPPFKAMIADSLEARLNALYSKFKMRGLEREYPRTRFEFEIKQIYAEPFFRLAYEFEQAGNFAKAEHYYKKTIEWNSYNYRALKNLAVLYFYKMNRREEGVRLLERYLEVNPYDAEAHSIRQVIESYNRK
jgi:hypothetical protein